ncbi:MAG: hypothetical protein WCS03_07640 [Bacteroidota bacterium]
MENAMGFPTGIAGQFRLRIPGAGLVPGRDKACLVSTIVAEYQLPTNTIIAESQSIAPV